MYKKHDSESRNCFTNVFIPLSLLEFGKVKKSSYTLLQCGRKSLVKMNVFDPSFFQSSSGQLNRTKDNIPTNMP